VQSAPWSTLPWFGICALVPAIAAGAPPPHLTLTSSSECPRAADVARELGPLLPTTEIDLGGTSDGPRAVLEDNGDELSIRIGEETRVLEDPARSCDERARSAAVFIGLVLDPPAFPAATPEEPKALPGKSGEPPAAREQGISVELGPLVRVAPGAGYREVPVLFGLGGRLVVGRTLGGSLGVGAFLPTTLRLDVADVRAVWLPLDLALRATARVDRAEFSIEGGPEVAWLIAAGQGVDNGRTSVRAEVGVRLALVTALRLGSELRGVAALQATYFPSRYDFELNPGLIAGQTPAWWAGGSLGVAFDVR
jgi:hypothetical protein